MTTLQEAFDKCERLAIESGAHESYKAVGEAFDELRTALAQQREQQPVCHGCGIPAGDVHMSTCKSGKWPSRVSNGDTAAPAQSAQQAATKNCPQPEICGSKECEFCRDTAAPVPQPAQESRHTIPR